TTRRAGIRRPRGVIHARASRSRRALARLVAAVRPVPATGHASRDSRPGLAYHAGLARRPRLTRFPHRAEAAAALSGAAGPGRPAADRPAGRVRLSAGDGRGAAPVPGGAGAVRPEPGQPEADERELAGVG